MKETYKVKTPNQILLGDPWYFKMDKKEVERLTVNLFPPANFATRVILEEKPFEDYPEIMDRSMTIICAPEGMLTLFQSGQKLAVQEEVSKPIGVDTAQYRLRVDAEIEHARYVGRTIEVDDLRGKNVPSVKNGTYYCDKVGFKSVDFDITKTQKPDNLMRVVYVEPHNPPYVAEIIDTLEGKQKAVKGFIEAVYIDDDNTCLVCNEEGKLIGLEGNRRIGNNGKSIIAGPFFVCGVGDEDFRGLTDEEVTKYMDRFKEPDIISEQETQADMGFVITGFNY